MRTDNERKDDIEFQKRLEEKLGKKFGHAIPKVDRNRPIEHNLEFVEIEREKLKEPLNDLDMSEYLLWRQFNNKNERAVRGMDVMLIDEPGISTEEIEYRIKYNREALTRITKEQMQEHPELFDDSTS